MKLPSNMNAKGVSVVCFLFVFAIAVAIFRDNAKEIMANVFHSEALPYIVCIYVGVAVVAKAIFSSGKGITSFEAIAETAFSVATYSLAGTTSITLLGGVYFQYFYNVQFFYKFGSLDLASIAVVSFYLLVYCGLVCTKMLTDVIFLANSSGLEPNPPRAT